MPVLSNAPLPGNNVAGNPSFAAQVGQIAGSGALGAVGLSYASNRKNVADMFKYSTRTAGPGPRFIYPDASLDWRVRVSLAPNSRYFYNDPDANLLLRPLVTEPPGARSDSGVGSALGGLFGVTGSKRIGVVFPYTPTVTIQHTANYTPQKLTHSNYAQYFYDNSEVGPITITTDFTVQNINEGQYLLAVIYFFRSCTKMFFGADPGAGNPPPVLYLNGYGQYYLPNVPCIVTSFSHTMPADVDYMDIPEPGILQYNPQQINYRYRSTRLPTTSQVSLSLQPIYSRLAQSQGFSLEDFSRGALINRPGGGGAASKFGATQSARYANNNIKNGGFL